MNERIKELAEQAGFVLIRDEYIFTEMMGKFAELIVAQCAQLADDCPADYLSQPYKYPSTYIKEYFGV